MERSGDHFYEENGGIRIVPVTPEVIERNFGVFKDMKGKLMKAGVNAGKITVVHNGVECERLEKISVENKEVIISVADEGIGIPPDLHQKIFERFFQGNGRKAGRRKGAGLGLAICQGIVETHGGRIWVESLVGKGSKFSFSLPLN